MAIQFHPQPGTILICDFDGLKEPEMIKRRPVVVIGPRLRNRGNLVTVVPFSTARPGDMCEFHHKLAVDPPLPAPYSEPFQWVKADMDSVKQHGRLNDIHLGRLDRGECRFLWG